MSRLQARYGSHQVGEIESLLFGLQIALGALIIGYFFGYYHRRNHSG